MGKPYVLSGLPFPAKPWVPMSTLKKLLWNFVLVESDYARKKYGERDGLKKYIFHINDIVFIILKKLLMKSGSLGSERRANFSYKILWT